MTPSLSQPPFSLAASSKSLTITHGQEGLCQKSQRDNRLASKQRTQFGIAVTAAASAPERERLATQPSSSSYVFITGGYAAHTLYPHRPLGGGKAGKDDLSRLLLLQLHGGGGGAGGDLGLVPVAVVFQRVQDVLGIGVDQVRPGLPQGMDNVVDEADLDNILHII